MSNVNHFTDANFNIPNEIKESLVKVLLPYADEYFGIGHYPSQIMASLITTFVDICSTWLALGEHCYSGEFILATKISSQTVLVIASEFGSCSFCDSFAGVLEEARKKGIDKNKEQLKHFLKENINRIFTIFTVKFNEEPDIEDIIEMLKDRKANGLLNTTLL